MQDLFPLLDPSRVVFGTHGGALDLLITTESIIKSYKKPFFADKVSSEMQHRNNFRQGERYSLNGKQLLALFSIDDTLKS